MGPFPRDVNEWIWELHLEMVVRVGIKVNLELGFHLGLVLE
jgi:hypothetical protein